MLNQEGRCGIYLCSDLSRNSVGGMVCVGGHSRCSESSQGGGIKAKSENEKRIDLENVQAALRFHFTAEGPHLTKEHYERSLTLLWGLTHG